MAYTRAACRAAHVARHVRHVRVCNAPDGFRVESPHMLELLGSACEAYKNDALALLHAEFPCPNID
jgi:hypothetical protein